jgi:hypothetical protein
MARLTMPFLTVEGRRRRREMMDCVRVEKREEKGAGMAWTMRGICDGRKDILVPATLAPTRTPPRNSQTAAIAQACLRERDLAATEVAKELATWERKVRGERRREDRGMNLQRISMQRLRRL